MQSEQGSGSGCLPNFREIAFRVLKTWVRVVKNHRMQVIRNSFILSKSRAQAPALD
jgi:hypothetical protein